MHLILVLSLLSYYPVIYSETIKSQSYVCLAVSRNNYNYGWGSKENKARIEALRKCAKNTPIGELCEIDFCNQN